MATAHLRRSALRLYFRTLRQLRLFEGDPTLDLSLRPGSVAAWAASLFDKTGRIEEVACLLGVRRLDRAARLIGWDWVAGSPGTEEAQA